MQLNQQFDVRIVSPVLLKNETPLAVFTCKLCDLF